MDRALDGGIPIRTLTAFVAPTRTQSELLLYQLAAAQPTHYVSTTCVDASEFYARLPGWIPEDNLSFQYVGASTLRNDPGAVLDPIKPETYVIVDNVDPLERVESRDAYLDWLNALATWLHDNDSVAVLHCTTTRQEDTTPQWRRLTEKRADYILEVERTVGSRQIHVRLLVAKARGGRALTEPLPLLLTDRIQIDTSRNIA